MRTEFADCNIFGDGMSERVEREREFVRFIKIMAHFGRNSRTSANWIGHFEKINKCLVFSALRLHGKFVLRGEEMNFFRNICHNS